MCQSPYLSATNTVHISKFAYKLSIIYTFMTVYFNANHISDADIKMYYLS